MGHIDKIYDEVRKLYDNELDSSDYRRDKRYWHGMLAAYDNVFAVIASVRREPTPSVWHKATDEPSPKDECLVISKHGKSVCIYANGLFYTGSVVSECCIYCNLSDVLSWARTEDLLKL